MMDRIKGLFAGTDQAYQSYCTNDRACNFGHVVGIEKSRGHQGREEKRSAMGVEDSYG